MNTERRAELRKVLLTADGRGREAKERALEELLRDARRQGVNAVLDEALNSGDGSYRP